MPHMGVELHQAVAFDQLAEAIEESGIPLKFEYKSLSSIDPSRYGVFCESAGAKTFRSTVRHSRLRRVY